MGTEPYLEGELRARFDAWLEQTVARHSPPLAFSEVRKGVRALSSLWVERRGRGGALDGAGKRAAFASYYAPLHFLTAHRALRGAALRVRRVVDLGCGSGAAGAAAATATGAGEVAGRDRSGWALAEAARTYAAFGLRARLRRAALPRGLPRLGAGDLVVLGWFANELGETDRETVLAALLGARRAGAAVLVLEPLAGGIAPWLDRWAAALAGPGGSVAELHASLELPEWVGRLDRAAGLDHGTLGARVLLAP